MSTHNDGHDSYGGHSKDVDEHKHRDIEGYGGNLENDTQQQYYSGEGQYTSDKDQHVRDFKDTDEDQNNSGESSGFELHSDSGSGYNINDGTFMSSSSSLFGSSHYTIDGGTFNAGGGERSYHHPLSQRREAPPPRSGMRGRRGEYRVPPRAGKILPTFLTIYPLHLALLQDIHILPKQVRVRVDSTNERVT